MLKKSPFFAFVVTLALAVTTFADEPRTLKVLRSFPVHHTDRNEDPSKRDARLQDFAKAVDAVTQDPTEKAALLTIARYESHIAAYVYENRCSDGPRGKHECDAGRAKGLLQLQPNDNHPVIPDDTTEQAEIAVRLWRGYRSRCARVVPDEFAGAFDAYGTGGSCAPSKWAKDRADYMRSIIRRL